MSIVGPAAASTTQLPPAVETVFAVFLLGLTAVSPVLAWRTGFFHSQNVDGPIRYSPSDRLPTFFFTVVLAIVSVVIGASVLHPMFRFLPKDQQELAASMVSMIFAFVAVVSVNKEFRRDGLTLLGLRSAGLRTGFLTGALALLIVLPWMIWMMAGIEAILRGLHVSADTEHPIFKIWPEEQTRQSFRAISIVAAVAIAPLAEESIFRGVIQTALTKLFSLGAWGRERIEQELTTSPEAPQTPFIQNRTWRIPTSRARWLAIVVASLLFAATHTPWTIQPPIFLLSLGLGYVYERTGNLWACIFMHMIFNALQFSLFLLTR